MRRTRSSERTWTPTAADRDIIRIHTGDTGQEAEEVGVRMGITEVGHRQEEELEEEGGTEDMEGMVRHIFTRARRVSDLIHPLCRLRASTHHRLSLLSPQLARRPRLLRPRRPVRGRGLGERAARALWRGCTRFRRRSRAEVVQVRVRG